MAVGVKYILSFLTLIFSLYAIHPENGVFTYIYAVHVLIISISSFSLFSYHNQPFSLFKVYHVFNLFFFGIAPMLQFYMNIAFVGENYLSYDDRLVTSFLILICTIAYNVVYYYFNSKSSYISFAQKIVLPFSNNVIRNNEQNLKLKILLLIISMFCFFCVFYINSFNFLGLFYRGGEILGRVSINKTSFLLIEKFVRPLSLMVFVSSMFYLSKSRGLNVVLFGLLILTASPLGMGRNAAAGFYIPLLLLFVPFFRRPNVFVSSFIYGLLVIFPSLDFFRRINDNGGSAKLAMDFKMFTELHFDAYASFARIISNNVITYGNQLLGVLFFYIPSSFWNSKPQSSGIFQADVLRLTFDNISCPFLAEGYINFGYFGVAIFLVFLAFVTAIFDKVYWSFSVFQSKNFFNLLYLISIGMFLFVLRGDLMNGFAYTTGMIVTGVFCFNIVRYFSRIK